MTAAHELVAELPVDRPAYMHSFGMTERYLVLVEFPLTVSALALKFSGKPFIRNYVWEPERGLRFHVIDKGERTPPPRPMRSFAFTTSMPSRTVTASWSI
jgi:carotenoid cleavage dioxygenase-like enzyme